eukprot:TRINITY_DN16458_c0_g1_i1.p1 TRINITY_DN16458_c0_g1~~TRINITY_DN16458_c0_g1_i1.p1  ORF type:complete len:118 (+),score=2.47 TRINITY_DN16458_c0_g1_i1:123-476(+)
MNFFRGESLCKLRNPHLPASPGLINDYFAACCNADLPVTASSVCLKRVLLERVGGFPELINIGEDQAVWGEVSCFTSIAYSPVVSCCLRFRGLLIAQGYFQSNVLLYFPTPIRTSCR